VDKSEPHPEIPNGHYCYFIESIEYGPKDPAVTKLNEIFGAEDKGVPIMKTRPCPHWGVDKSRGEHGNGFCRLLGINDWTANTLLWDQIKECGINMEGDEHA
jgi:hypothetical protein